MLCETSAPIALLLQPNKQPPAIQSDTAITSTDLIALMASILITLAVYSRCLALSRLRFHLNYSALIVT
jgi:hypothetical protein